MSIKSRKSTISNLSMDVDGSECIGTTFRQVRLIYKGGKLPTLTDCQFSECQLRLNCPDERKEPFLAVIRGAGAGGQELADTSVV